jgi:hypothetical protein
MRILITGLVLSFAALVSGCIIIPVGGHHHGYYDGPRGDGGGLRYDNDGGRGYR